MIVNRDTILFRDDLGEIVTHFGSDEDYVRGLPESDYQR